VVKTNGNQMGHIVLRGGRRPNYDALSIEEARLELAGRNLPEGIMVDCSHANSKKKYQGQTIVWKNIVDQYVHGNDAIVGLMLESHLHEGNQKFSGDFSQLKYGVSITDECISWETTEKLIRYAHEKLGRLRHNMMSYEAPEGIKTMDNIQEPLW
jgi:3-deoxy-7-phosphoheptulonate synthase